MMFVLAQAKHTHFMHFYIRTLTMNTENYVGRMIVQHEHMENFLTKNYA